MAIQAPPMPVDPTPYLSRLNLVVLHMYQTSADCTSRQRFANLLDLVIRKPQKNEDCPLQAQAAKSDLPTRPAMIYATIVKALRLVWANEGRDDIEAAVRHAEWCSTAGAFKLCGDRGIGYTMAPESK